MRNGTKGRPTAGVAILAVVILLAAVEVAAQPSPDPVDSIEKRIRALLAEDRWLEALNEARDHTARLPDEPRLRSVLAEALYRAGLFEELEAVVAPLVETSGAAARSLMTLGRLRLAEGRESEAVELLSAALAAAPDDRDVCYWASGATANRAVAVERLERYLELSEGDHPDRIESARSSIRVYRALGERSVWLPVDRPERIELPLVRLWDASTGRVTGFVVKARLGKKGKPVPLLLDSGSPGFFIIRRVARKRGFVPLAEATAFGGGGDQRHETSHGTFQSFDLGGLRFEDALASSSRLELDPTGRYHGILGLSLFRGYRITLDLRNDLLILEPPGEAPEGQPYWSVGGQLLVRADVEAPDAAPFLLDTGATSTIVDLSLANRIEGAEIGVASRVVGFGGAIQGARVVRGVEVALQGVRSGSAGLAAADFALRSRLGGVEIGGFIGLDVLEGSRIVIDTSGRRIALIPADGR